MLDVCLLGTGGMMPMPNRFLTSLFLRLNGRYMMIDCGEGTQISLKLLGWGFKNIDVICFTHYHADHISGLPGLLLTIGNSDRTEPLTLIGPPRLKDVVNGLRKIAPDLPYEIHFIELSGDNMQASVSGFNIKALPLNHRIPCLAYSVDIPRDGKFNLEKAQALNLPVHFWGQLQRGNTVHHEGKTYLPEMVMGEARKGIKIAYCTDTRPVSALPEFVNGADLFICEGMYGEPDKKEKVMAYKHMLFSEAAQIARDGNVSELWLTHFSPALPNPHDFVHFAKDIFPNSICGKDRMTKTILFEED